ncbi:conserved protein of unknown function [Nitrospira japonica]|uniref:Helix-turn-helix domain-containing protein n=1 Tax=Nitrospira japonica TaxID=1325564 RepID=A0A1W1I470_9BACT|nr:helix-turn-helix domain-containing protein [Nitrospira japonica]SLM47817.1 conserved protein of unknown function [Nitrospira japonica]
MEKTLFRVGEAADFLSVSRWTIYRWLEQGKLRGTKIGKGSIRVFRDSLDGLIQQNRTDDWTRSSVPAAKWPSTVAATAMHPLGDTDRS